MHASSAAHIPSSSPFARGIVSGIVCPGNRNVPKLTKTNGGHERRPGAGARCAVTSQCAKPADVRHVAEVRVERGEGPVERGGGGRG